MKKEIIRDVVDWDVTNWTRAIRYWEKHVNINLKKHHCMELGTAYGGISLWLALNGNAVLCTDIRHPEKLAGHLHRKYACACNIRYEAVDATDIPYENEFDIIVFKSILGGIQKSDTTDPKIHTLNEIHKALKPGGMLLFAENLASSPLHRFLRRKYGTPQWDYLELSELERVFSSFSSVNYITTGFFGCFGRTEKQRNILGRIDGLLEYFIPKSKRYIISGIAKK